MTDLMTRPILRVKATAEPPRRPIPVTALVAGVAAAVIGLLVSVAVAVGVWFDGSTGSFGDAVRVGAFGWLVSNGTGVELSGTAFTAVPLGFLALFSYCVYRGGHWCGATSAVRHGGDVLAGTVLVAIGYVGAGLVVRAVARTDTATTDLLRTVVALGAVGLVFGALGVVTGSQSWTPVLGLLPTSVRAALAGSLAGVAVMVAAGGALLVGSFLVHFSQAVTLQEGLAAGTVGSLALTVIGMAAVPNAVLCAGAFVAGPGFQVGTGTSVAPGDVHLGAVPGLPVLAALPSSGHQAWWHTLLVLVPVAAGAVAGVVCLRHGPGLRLGQATLRGALSGLVGGVGFGLSTWLATGAIGPGRMQDIGPMVLPTTAVCGGALLVGGALAACAVSWWQSPRGSAPGSPATAGGGGTSTSGDL